jgi:uncharacterized membrane protein
MIRVLRAALVVGMVGQGINHFVNDHLFVRMMPGYLPWHLELVWWSGIAEIVLGLAVIPQRTRRIAGWGLLALLVAVFPANLEMALHPDRWPELPELALWLRLPFQPLLLWWVWVVCLRRPHA